MNLFVISIFISHGYTQVPPTRTYACTIITRIFHVYNCACTCVITMRDT